MKARSLCKLTVDLLTNTVNHIRERQCLYKFSLVSVVSIEQYRNVQLMCGPEGLLHYDTNHFDQINAALASERH